MESGIITKDNNTLQYKSRQCFRTNTFCQRRLGGLLQVQRLTAALAAALGLTPPHTHISSSAKLSAGTTHWDAVLPGPGGGHGVIGRAGGTGPPCGGRGVGLRPSRRPGAGRAGAAGIPSGPGSSLQVGGAEDSGLRAAAVTVGASLDGAGRPPRDRPAGHGGDALLALRACWRRRWPGPADIGPRAVAGPDSGGRGVGV